MLYVMVIAALIVIPIKLGGYARVFELANQTLATHTPAGSIFLKPSQFLGYSTLAIGSAIALMLYPHTATAVLSAKSSNVVRRNAAMLPAYSFLLGLIALLGYLRWPRASSHEGHQLRPFHCCFSRCFPSGLRDSALRPWPMGALVPAAIMSIAAARIFSHGTCRIVLLQRQD